MHRIAAGPFSLVTLVASLRGAVATVGPWSFTVRAENDLPVNSDRYYTNGINFSSVHCTDERDALWPQVLRLPGLDRSDLLATGFDAGQIMVTPADIHRIVPDPRDRPYAGRLFVSASWQRFADDHYAALKLITGVVGPESLAEQTQKAVHRAIGVGRPLGWDHQLHTEPILNAVYERRWRVQTLIRGMGALPPARDAAPWGAHAFAGTGAPAVAHNITLDGNSFRFGPSVGHRPFVPAAEAGVVVRGRGWQLTTSWVAQGREFNVQPFAARFGTVAFTVFR